MLTINIFFKDNFFKDEQKKLEAISFLQKELAYIYEKTDKEVFVYDNSYDFDNKTFKGLGFLFCDMQDVHVLYPVDISMSHLVQPIIQEVYSLVPSILSNFLTKND